MGVTATITATQRYDKVGNVTESRDGRGNATAYSYRDCGDTYALVAKVTNPAGHVTRMLNDCDLGRPRQITDPNGVVTTVAYADDLDRPTEVVRASGLSAASRTSYIYGNLPNNSSITTVGDLESCGNSSVSSYVFFDGLGRQKLAQTAESGDLISVQQTYDAMGRLHQVSNPYRTGEGPQWTTTEYDALGRLRQVTTPDGAATLTNYSGNQVTVTDPDLKTRRSVTDAAGRLTQVVENPSLQGGQLSLTTSYTYDTLDNLTRVNQSGQIRRFEYDRLSRLTSATNPESGTVNYTSYDGNGNLLSKADARGVTTSFGYDPLNRVYMKSYSDGTPLAHYG